MKKKKEEEKQLERRQKRRNRSMQDGVVTCVPKYPGMKLGLSLLHGGLPRSIYCTTAAVGLETPPLSTEYWAPASRKGPVHVCCQWTYFELRVAVSPSTIEVGVCAGSLIRPTTD